MSKNIVVFSDGTGQEGGKGNDTNIYKSFKMIEDRSPKQVCFYDPGLGTGWRKITGNVGGMGMSRNIKECYQFIFDHFEAGDRIFLFGFSRGAATVRSLSHFINYFGILPKSRPELINKAYKLYKIGNDDKLRRKARNFVNRHRTMWTRIEFLGCYDTVAALGLPFKTPSAILNKVPGFRHKFHRFTLNECVVNACQALALDDERKTFQPIIWNEANRKDGQDVSQVWFTGMHTDVGGGYQPENEEKISDIPLVWLTQKAVESGLRIYRHHKVEIHEDADGPMHNSREWFFGKLFRRKRRSWDSKKFTFSPVVHQSVLDRKNNPKNGYQPWIVEPKSEYEFVVEPWVLYQNQPWHIDKLKEKPT